MLSSFKYEPIPGRVEQGPREEEHPLGELNRYIFAKVGQETICNHVVMIFDVWHVRPSVSSNCSPTRRLHFGGKRARSLHATLSAGLVLVQTHWPAPVPAARQ